MSDSRRDSARCLVRKSAKSRVARQDASSCHGRCCRINRLFWSQNDTVSTQDLVVASPSTSVKSTLGVLVPDISSALFRGHFWRLSPTPCCSNTCGGTRFLRCIRLPHAYQCHGITILFDGQTPETRRMLSFQLCTGMFSSPKPLAVTPQLIVTPVELGCSIVDRASRYWIQALLYPEDSMVLGQAIYNASFQFYFAAPDLSTCRTHMRFRVSLLETATHSFRLLSVSLDFAAFQ
jgi:hypothetical protein